MPVKHKIDRRARYRARKIREGKCVLCGETKEGSVYLRVCDGCGERRKEAQRLKKGSKPWAPGGPGRKPNRVVVEEEKEKGL